MSKQVLYFLVAMLFPGFLSGQRADTSFWRVNGDVYALETCGDTLFAGGSFSHLGPPVFNLALVDTITGIPDLNFPQTESTSGFISDDHGGLIIFSSGSAIHPYADKVFRVDSSGSVMQGWPSSWPGSSVVSALTPSFAYGDKLYFTGNFSQLDAAAPPGALIDTAGQVLWRMPEIDGIVRASAADGNGGCYIIGDFTQVDHQPRKNAAHLDSNGQLTPWAPVLNGYLTCILSTGTAVFIGGDFTVSNGQSCSGLAKVDAVSGANFPGWQMTIGGTITIVNAIDTSGNVIYMGGTFSAVNSSSRVNLAAIDIITGSVLPWNPYSNTDVRAIKTIGGNIYVGGSFTLINSQTRNHIACLDANGLLQAWNPSADNNVNGLNEGTGCVYVWGDFTTIGSAGRRYAARIDIATGSALSWNLNLPTMVFSAIPRVASVLEVNSIVYVGGSFTQLNSQPVKYIARTNISSGLPLSFSISTSSYLRSIEQVAPDKLFISGDFTSINAPAHLSLAQADLNTGLVTPWAAGMTAGNSIKIFKYNGSVFIVGSFSEINNITRNNIAAVDTVTGALTSFYPDVNGAIYDAWQSDSLLFIQGAFTQINSIARNGFAVINLQTGALSNFNPVFTGYINTVYTTSRHIVFGGNFTQVNSISRTHLAAFDKINLVLDPSWSPSLDGMVTELAGNGDLIFTYGTFFHVNGIPRRRLASINDSTGSTGSLDIALGDNSSNVFSMECLGNRLCIAGTFGSVGYIHAQNIAAFQMSSGLPLSWNSGTDGTVFALKRAGNRLYAGGDFDQAGGNPLQNLAAFDLISGQVIPSFDPQPDSTVLTIQLLSDGLLAGGYFTHLNSVSTSSLVKTDTSGTVMSFGANPDGPVFSLAKQGNRIFAGGDFLNIGGQARSNIAALDTNGIATVWNPSADRPVHDILPSGNVIYTCGEFFQIGGQSRRFIAAIDGTSGLSTSWDIPGTGIDKYYTLCIDNNVIYTGGNFTSLASNMRINMGCADRLTATIYPWHNGEVAGQNLSNQSGLYVYKMINTYRGMFIAGKIRGTGDVPATGFMLFPHERRNLAAGKVYSDLNHDSIQNGLDYPLRNTLVNSTAANNFALTNQSGNWSFFCDTGTYSFSPTLPFLYTNSSPASAQVSFYSFGQTDTTSLFALQPLDSVRELEIIMLGRQSVRPGIHSSYSIFWQNNGTQQTNAVITLKLDSFFTIDSTSLLPAGVSADSIFWNSNGLMPGESRTLQVYTTLSSLAMPGNYVCSNVHISPVLSDTIRSNNADSICQEVRAAYDPNLKEVNPHDSIVPPGHNSLSYNVLFQNTGTDTAIIVFVTDTLDPSLDPATLSILAASHPYSVQINQGVLIVTFSDIMLPDSTTNEPASHGFFKYSISCNPNLPLGTIIRNTANIYFDFNSPVITNTVNTTIDIVFNPGTGNEFSEDISLIPYPNPFTNELNLKIRNRKPQRFTYWFTDVTGNQIGSEYTFNAETGVQQIRLNTPPALAAGFYFLTFKNEETEYTIRLVCYGSR